MPAGILGAWKVKKFEHNLKSFNSAEKTELKKIANSSTYVFDEEFNVSVRSEITEKPIKGDWYWDSYRKKLVINENKFLSPNIDTITIKELTKNSMIWAQKSGLDTIYIHLKRLK